MINSIIALGVGRNTPVMIDFALACGYTIEGLYHYDDSRTGKFDHGYKILGSFNDLWNINDLSGKNFLLTMGNIEIRENLIQKILSKGGNLPTLIHPMAVVSSFAKISSVGVCVFPFTFIQSDSIIADNTIILSHVNISHNTSIGSNCFIAGSAVVGAYTTVENRVFIGQGALIISEKVDVIGHDSFIAAGALVTHPVPHSSKVIGYPARIV